MWRWEFAVGAGALVTAAVAFWVTLDAHFLEYPAWSAVQKADFILGPVGVGLYWHHRRPGNRLGLRLIVLGLIGIAYILESSTSPVLFPIAVIAEAVFYVMTSLVILSFPSGLMEGAAAKLTFALTVLVVLPLTTVEALAIKHPVPGFSISGCRSVCPANGLAILPVFSWLPTANDVRGWLVVVIPLATAAVLACRFVSGTPPRRRALAIGAPVAVLFLFTQASYRAIYLIAPSDLSPGVQPVQSVLQWTFAAGRSLTWYGFLVALIAAELYAGRVLRRLNRDSLGRPTFRELEEMLRGPLGDPGLRLGFWHLGTSDWVDAEGAALAPPGSDQRVTEVDRNDRAVIAIIHDAQLSDDPELLQAAGAVALLALENAELDSAWQQALRDLRDSRARITRAGDQERRKLERDLHDGAQQRLLGALLRFSFAEDLADADSELKHRLEAAGMELQHAIDELRELARGIYPTILANSGLEGAIRALSRRFPDNVAVTALRVGRYPLEIETAFYYCCLEAVQNAIKHAGDQTRISIRLNELSRELHLEVRDNGQGFDPGATPNGIGLENMRDRLGAVGGHLKITSSPHMGTLVAASAQLDSTASPADVGAHVQNSCSPVHAKPRSAHS